MRLSDGHLLVLEDEPGRVAPLIQAATQAGLGGRLYVLQSRREAVEYFQRVIERMKGAGCDAVVLGCTEIPLIMNDANSPLPTLDSTRLLALAALRHATETLLPSAQ